MPRLQIHAIEDARSERKVVMGLLRRSAAWSPLVSSIGHVFSGSVNGATSVSLGGNGVNGDVVVGGATSTSSSSAIALGDGCSQPSVGGLIEAVSISGTSLYGIAGYKVVSAGASETWGGWSGAASVTAGIYSGVDTTAPILALAWASGTSSSVSYPPLSHADPTAWVVAFLRTSADVTAPPTLLVPRTTGTRRGQWDSDGGMTNYPGETVTASGAPVRWITCTMALRSA